MSSEAPAVVQGVYADYKRVPSRKTFQLIVEVPIEQAQEVHKAFGEPNPLGATWVAVALLNPEHAKLKQAFKDSVEAEKKGGRLAKQAGMLCGEVSFRTFLREKHGEDVHTDEDAKQFLYMYCGIDSRKELDHNTSAADNFDQIDGEYRAWLQV